MDSVSIRELKKYQAMWSMPEYRKICHGLDFFIGHRHEMGRFKSVLDIGCGTGRLLRYMVEKGYDAEGVDFAFNCLDEEVKKCDIYPAIKFHEASIWEMNLERKFEVGICADVMEHIPEERINKTLANIHKHCSRTYYVIANYESKYLGHLLHVTRKPKEWWKEVLEGFGEVRQLGISRAGKQGVFAFEVIS